MCTPDYRPSSPTRFNRSKTVKVKTFPLFKNLNKTPLFRRGHTATTARPFLTPQHAESHPFKTPLHFFVPTMPYYRPFNFTCALHFLLTHVQWLYPTPEAVVVQRMGSCHAIRCVNRTQISVIVINSYSLHYTSIVITCCFSRTWLQGQP